MKIRYKEDPREWRKSVWLTALGLSIVSLLFSWLSWSNWGFLVGAMGLWALAAWCRPGWFRGYYRVSLRVGVWLSHVVARVALTLIFWLIVTPLGLVLRLSGKDLLRLRRRPETDSYWSKAPELGPLDRLF